MFILSLIIIGGLPLLAALILWCLASLDSAAKSDTAAAARRMAIYDARYAARRARAAGGR